MQLHRQEGAVMPAVAGLHSWLWWAARALLLNQRLLGGRAASLKAAVQDCMQQVGCGSPAWGCFEGLALLILAAIAQPRVLELQSL